MKMTLSRKILTGFVCCAVVLLTVAYFSIHNNRKFLDTNQLVMHTHEVMYEFEQVLAATVDMETGMRGFMVSGDEKYLDPFNLAKLQISSHLDKVERLTADNPAQQKNIDGLKKQIQVIRDYQSNIVDLRRKDVQQATQIFNSGKGKQLQDEIRQMITSANSLENELLTKRKALSEEDAGSFNMLLFALVAVMVVVLMVVYFIITNNLNALRKAEKEREEKNWILTGSYELNEKTRGELQTDQLAKIIVGHLCTYLNAQVGVIYVQEHGQLYLAGSYASNQGERKNNSIALGEGLAGQAALEKKTILFTDIPDDYIKINSALGESKPRHITAIPLLMDDALKAVVEIGTIRKPSALDISYLNQVSENIAIIISAAQSRTMLKSLLEETQQQAEELKTQQEELRQTNEELQEKTILLEKSEEELKTQQEELQQSNEELEEKANLLEIQKEKLELSKEDIQAKAKELELTGKYKSEFLANMSHELRTPLNSILILSQLLAENKNKTLGEKEIEFSKNIHHSGNDLLNLINEILDLSKVEAGKMELDINEVPLQSITTQIGAMFNEVAKNKFIEFTIVHNKQTGDIISTDKQRLEQILRNLLSNAFKFTPRAGKVSLTISKASPGILFRNSKLADVSNIVAFSVTDTGIGIPEDKLDVVFEAFQQADGSTKRKYGGTGLGLSISKELAGALGGEIHVSSEADKGSNFTLYLPSFFDGSVQSSSERVIEVKEKKEKHVTRIVPSEKFPIAAGETEDDRYIITENDKVILIMEDDGIFSKILLDFVRGKNYKGIVAAQGNVGLSYARHYKPDAIILDMKLPVMDGTEVLKHLKNAPDLRHIPVQIISGYDLRKEGLALGAFDFMHKPAGKNELNQVFTRMEDFISKKLKKLLIVEDNENQNRAIRELIGNGDVKSFSAYSGKEAHDMMKNEKFDCVIVDLGLPDMSGFELLEKIKADEQLKKVPIIVYTGKDISKEENARLMRSANTVVLKTADSQERLLDETMLFLHRVESRLPREKQHIIRKLHKSDEVLKDKKILLVDDDIRNIYSLTNVLEDEGMICVTAENGKNALEVLQENPDTAIILMDVMMPEMDGYEATREIRRMEKFVGLPVIAITAKAMKGDREKCLDAGMSDYISKPVDIGQLLSLMRVWLYA
jgi:CheY-like chemotaxis protein/CHASE3 domain sensor protein/putative methionine-R-sulfoxide reductase with GAF domain